MRRWPVHLFCWCALLLPAPLSRSQTSEKMREQILEALPKFDPHAAAAAKPARPTVGTPAPLSDDPVVQLPVFHVVSPKASTDDDAWLSPQARQAKALKEYKDSMTSFEWLLNCFYIPFVTPSPQARADAAYADKKIAREVGRLSELIDAVSRVDPKGAKELSRDLDFSQHPSN